MKKAVRARELPPAKLRWRCAAKTFDFRTTADIKPCQDIIGQDRALAAIKTGLKLEHRGYNIFITGLAGTGRTTTIKHLLERLEKKGPIPPDVCYMNNFRNAMMPRCIELAAGQGNELHADMNRLMTELMTKIPSVFQSEYYKERRKKLIEDVQAKQKDIIGGFEKEIAGEGFAMVRMQIGPIVKPEIVPVVDGAPVQLPQLEKLAEEGKLPKEKIKTYEESAEKLAERMQQVYAKVKDLEREANRLLEKLDRETVEPVIRDLIQEIDRKYRNDELSRELEDVEAALMHKLDLFRSSEEEGQQGQQAQAAEPGEREDPFREFRVNVVVDNSETKAPPVVIENFPNFRNLFGAIERDLVLGGVSRTDHMNIRAGSFHRANGGHLVLNALDVLIEPGVWQSLKRTLKSSEAVIQSYDPWSFMGSSTLKPEPMKLKVKIVLIGDDYLYYLLYQLDEDFRKIFKIKAEFDHEVKSSASVIKQYAGFVRALADKERLKPFDRSGVCALVEYGVRLAGRQNKLSTRFSEIADVIREAEYIARGNGNAGVRDEDVRAAIRLRIERVNLIEDKIQEHIDEGTLIIDTAGRVVGQVNGLSVYDLGDYLFGRPSRITARTAIGNAGVINIERESDLSGRTHNKGVLILAGYFRGKYGEAHPLAMSASLCFEQSYGGVDGDSASSAELYAILSSIGDLPLRQDIAVTGSINQKGEIQPIGGVNEKIEGFYRVCKSRGLAGSEGVIIPERNVGDLMLDEEVVEAVSRGKFHVYPVRTVDEGIAILAGVPAGKPSTRGTYPKGTVHRVVQDRLLEMALVWHEFGKDRNAKKDAKHETGGKAAKGRTRCGAAGARRPRRSGR
jgi:ATP-dependent Lon protease